jgi:hypothetical protein
MSTPTTSTPAPANAELIKAIREHAKVNYENGGWSFIVEAWSDEDITKAIGLVKTPAGAIKKLAPVMAALAEQAGFAPAKPAKPAAEPKPVRHCRCGCGAQVARTFAIGHDQRFLSAMRAAVKAGTMEADDALAQAREISPAFEGKVAKSMAQVAAEIVKAQEAADAKAAEARENARPRATAEQADATSKAA